MQNYSVLEDTDDISLSHTLSLLDASVALEAFFCVDPIVANISSNNPAPRGTGSWNPASRSSSSPHRFVGTTAARSVPLVLSGLLGQS
ncbi:hypothetical protein DTO280E4_5697 [Paecilomyces variotii]|nr:hypothetical protein DTO280E4_5697 [Paecilomyces variotii]